MIFCLNQEQWLEQRNNESIVSFNKISEIEDGIGVTVNKTEKIAKTLIEATGGESGPVSHPIKPGNLNASVEAIERLSMIHAGLKEPPSHSEIEVCTLETKYF